MNDKERDSIDDLFRSKLYDFEAETIDSDWDAIAGRLPVGRVVPFYRKAGVWVAAAAIAILLTIGGLFMIDSEDVSPQIAQEIERRTEEVKTRMEKGVDVVDDTYQAVQPELATRPVLANQSAGKKEIRKVREIFPVGKSEEDKELKTIDVGDDERKVSEATSEVDKQREDVASKSPGDREQEAPVLLADAATRPAEKEKVPRRWGFGMGAGGVSVGASNSVPNYMVSTMGLRSEDLIILNAASEDKPLPKTDIHHNKPVSFGLGINYYLNDRWALQSGLNYSYLSSNWNTTPVEGGYQVKVKQQLHMVGIPLSVTYKIAEWNRFMVYASAGVLAELNVAGTQKGELVRDINSQNVTWDDSKKSTRMKEPLLSVNARAGVSYPLLRFLSAYGEVGAGYHFDNGSSFMDEKSDNPIIYSEKPFNLSVQLGFRLGF
ncbi:opacity protein-like surface antigen [Parabacteroides sp. PFB2-10]|uniref:porin family protein n=1 Tax=Parabacteroides sp. PFB2-10 TaxID=1742405 RepID=UPI002475A2B2|nr:porin family protein [Parabacteroides sp. PFB2-10]MDH6313596.1 opacity protein-like surface antigen [Parabacteroides sp. PFB2-10]